ncbi:MAG TPA: ASCH domain-containing protein [bacterium]|nr:ASCH domain-containing protein [bacterium]
MKTLKFREKLSQIILQGNKTTTWRLFDDKNLATGDIVSFLVWETKSEFAQAKLVTVRETTLGKLTEADWDGHEKFKNNQEMYDTYSRYYQRPVDEHSPVKIIKFELL